MIAGRDSRFRGTQGTAIVGLFGAAVAWTGANEKTLDRLGDTDYEKVYLYPNSHAGYYPGAKPIAMKVLFRKSDGRVLGAQAVGEDGVDKRISDARARDPDGRHGVRPRGGRALLRAAVRQRQGPGQLRRHGRRRRAARRHAAEPLGLHDDGGFLLDVREKRGARRGAGARRGQHPDGRAARPPRRAAPRPGDPRRLPLRVSAPTTATRILLQNGFDARVVSGGMLSHAILARAPQAGDPRVSARVTDQATNRPAGGSAIACTTEQTLLGEGARWDARRSELLRVDILAGRVFRDRSTTTAAWSPVRTYSVPGTVGAIAPVDGDDGWLLAAGRGFVHLSPDGSLRSIAEVAPAGTRMNDARVRPAGPILGRHAGRRPPRRRRRALPARSRPVQRS